MKNKLSKCNSYFLLEKIYDNIILKILLVV